MPALTVRAPQGTVAALLTALEFVLGALATLSAHALLHGLWIRALRRAGHAPVQRVRLRELLGAVLGAALVVGVALVESGLETAFVIAGEDAPPGDCIGMRADFEPQRIKWNPPAFRVAVDEWMMQIVPQLGCGDGAVLDSRVALAAGIDSVGVEVMQAPTCAEESIESQPGGISSAIRFLSADDDAFTIVSDHSDSIVVFPTNGSDIGHSVMDNGEVEHNGRCGAVGVSSYRMRAEGEFETRMRTSETIAAYVHGTICDLHGQKYGSAAITALDKDAVEPNLDEPEGDRRRINVPGLESAASKYSVTMTNVSALFLRQKAVKDDEQDEDDRTVYGKSVACTTADIAVDYIFISAEALQGMNDKTQVDTLPVLIPTALSVIRGHCEVAAGPLAHNALLYSAESAWDGDEIGRRFGHVERYYAYMMAVSSGQYPLNQIGGKEDPGGENCRIRVVKSITRIPISWQLLVLVCSASCALLVVIVGTCFRVWFRGDLWGVGSHEWSLHCALFGETNESVAAAAGRNGPVIDVVAIKPEDAGGEVDGADSPFPDGLGKSRFDFLRTAGVQGLGLAGAGIPGRSDMYTVQVRNNSTRDGQSGAAPADRIPASRERPYWISQDEEWWDEADSRL